MAFLTKFTKLMKGGPPQIKKKTHLAWVIDERKCLCIGEVNKLRRICNKARSQGLQNRQFTKIRNWFMVELGLNSGLRVEEMASLKHNNLLIDRSRPSIVLMIKVI